MQDPEHGVPVRSQKLFLTSIPAAFMGKQPASAAGKCFLLRDVNLSISLIYVGQPLIKESTHPIIEHSAKIFYIIYPEKYLVDKCKCNVNVGWLWLRALAGWLLTPAENVNNIISLSDSSADTAERPAQPQPGRTNK